VSGPRNRQLALPYLLPYALYVALASVPPSWLGREASYAARLVVVGATLAWAWRRLRPLTGPRAPLVSVAAGVAAGLLGTVVWVALLAPFVGPGDPWGDTAFWLRFVAAGALVPVFEEVAMRGYVLRFLVQWQEARRAGADDPFGEAWERRSIRDAPPGAATLAAVLLSSAVFALGHAPAEMPAAFAYGALMAALWIVRKDLLSCIAAHATTNVSLALWVRATDAWGYW
jgi:membrane protease YdiL (CAAX protease family)